LVFLDSDDILLPWGLETYNRIIRQLDSPALIIGSIAYFHDEKTLPAVRGADVLEVFRYPDFLSKDVTVFVSCSNIVVKKSVFERAGGLRNSTPTTFHMDTFDMLLRFGVYGPCVVLKRPHTVGYRTHSTNTVRDV